MAPEGPVLAASFRIDIKDYMMKKTVLTFAVLCMAASVMEAKVTLPQIFGDNMVLQQQTEVKIWGKAEPSSRVTVRPSWDRKSSVTVTSDADGKWMASVATPEAGGPYSVEISDGEKLVLDNVLIGEVWFCSGQSNMEMPVRGFDNQPVEGSADVILGARPEIPVRFCTVSKATSVTPLEDCETEWMENTPEAVARASATAYFFGQYLQKILDVPVGLIISDWGGTAIETWMDRETLSSKFPEFDLSFLDKGETRKNVSSTPTQLYNAMVAPVIPYTIKGMLWYQGEANIGRPEQYRKLMSAYVGMMRDKWDLGEMPFYYVQIAPFSYGDPEGLGAAYLREAQLQSWGDIPNSGMAVTLDIGDADCIHPAKKQEVGKRLALMALHQTYGKQVINPYSPVYRSWAVEDGKIHVWFDKADGGLSTRGHLLDGFEVAGPDKVFYPATARVAGYDVIEVYCPEEVKEPAAVRYGFHNCAEASLFNLSGIPASPFRTDNW